MINSNPSLVSIVCFRKSAIFYVNGRSNNVKSLNVSISGWKILRWISLCVYFFHFNYFNWFCRALEKYATKKSTELNTIPHQLRRLAKRKKKKLSKQIQSRNDDLIRFFYVLLTIFFKCTAKH